MSTLSLLQARMILSAAWGGEGRSPGLIPLSGDVVIILLYVGTLASFVIAYAESYLIPHQIHSTSALMLPSGNDSFCAGYDQMWVRRALMREC